MSVDSESIESQFNINADNSNGEKVYEFEGFRLDARRLMLYHGGRAADLAPKVVETLLKLVEAPGVIISKTELLETIWKDAHVDDSNLTQNLYLLRKELGDTESGVPMIETFRRRGYRFNGRVSKVADRPPLGERLERSAQETDPPGSPKHALESLVVLPFENERADPDAEYLSDGITDSIINRLSQLNQLRVVARSTAFRYKASQLSPQQIGRELGVRAVLAGRVLRHGEQLIVRAELVDAMRGWQLWGTQLNTHALDILAVQESLATAITENLQLKLTRTEQSGLTRRFTESAEAYHLYIKGRYELHKRLTESIERAAEFFRNAIDADPSYALAYVGLADCYPLMSLYGKLTPAQAYPKAKAAALKALELDDRLTTAHNALGVIKLFYEWDWEGAEAAFKAAIELNPGYPDAHQRYGMLLTATERFAEAEIEMQRAQELDPLSLITRTIGAYPYYYSRDYEKAAECFRSVIAIDPDYSMAHFRLGLTYAQSGKYEMARSEVERSVELSNDRDTIAALAYVQGLAGDKAGWARSLAELAERETAGFVSAYDRVLVYVGSGDHHNAMKWLDKAIDERSYWLIYMKVDPALDPIRNDPDFAASIRTLFS